LLGVVTLATLSVVAFNAAIRAWIRVAEDRHERRPGNLRAAVYRRTDSHGEQQAACTAGSSPRAAAGATRQAPTLIVMHGWGANSEMMLPLADPFYHAGYALLIVNARNHGWSERDARSSAPHFAEDLECALDWLLLQPNVDRQRRSA
jgi:pimeloyl-ACP methyl ester carboxylesterase